MQKKIINVWNLQLFAEGAEAGPAEGTPNGSGDIMPNSSDDVIEAAAHGVDTETATQNGTEGNETVEESFSDLIKGKYKQDFNKETSKIVRKRVKGLQGEIETRDQQLNQMAPMVNLLFNKYGIEPGNYESLTKAVINDDSNYEAEAIRRGLDIDTTRELMEIEAEKKALEDEKAAAEVEAQKQEQFKIIRQQELEIQKTYPNFDFAEEYANNEMFAALVDYGFDIQNAFESAHVQDLDTIKAQAIASETAKKVTAAVKSNSKRPVENGLMNTAGSKVTKDPSSLTEKEIDEMFARAEAGENIHF